MLRLLALLLLGLLFVFDGGPSGVAKRLVQPGAASSETVDCCPDRPGAPEHAGDCCDFDFGACCAAGLVALVPTPPEVRDPRHGVDEDRGHLAPHLLRPRTTGPPPTPPPIG